MKKTVLSHDDHTIIAQSTPQGTGALSLIRLTGLHAVTIADKLCILKSSKLIDKPSHTIHYGNIVTRDNVILDKVLIFLMRAPHTFTGQDTVEFSCHNNIFVIQSIIEEALFYGARLAQQGEFTKRAFTQGKIDLIQAEAINDLILHANSPLAIKKSLAQIEGSLSNVISSIEKKLLKALAFTQASFEFIDEENINFDQDIKQFIEQIILQVSTIKKSFSQQNLLRTGIRVSLIGSVNAGKSSLFNALLKQERSIVTSIAGTTRDSIEAGIYRQGIYLTFVDTAGLRQTNDIIEKMGIERSLEQAVLADIILLVVDTSRLMTEQEHDLYESLKNQYHTKIILVYNKIDLKCTISYSHPAINQVECSSTTSIGIAHLEQLINEKISQLLSINESPYLLNLRQFNLLSALSEQLLHTLVLLENKNQHELISIHLEDALSLSTELTGKAISEQAMDAIFREFCIGK